MQRPGTLRKPWWSALDQGGGSAGAFRQSPPLPALGTAARVSPSSRFWKFALRAPLWQRDSAGRHFARIVCSTDPAGAAEGVETNALIFSALLSFGRLSNADNQNCIGITVYPHDPKGDVGPNNFVEIVNLLSSGV